MSEVSVFLEAIDRLRMEMHQQHGRQTERYEALSRDVNQGFDKLRGEMKVQNGRVAALEIRASVIEESAKPINRAVYGFISLTVLAVLGALLTMVISK